MEVLVGSTFSIDVPSPPAPYVVPSQDKHHPVPASLFLEEEEDGADDSPISRGIGSGSGMDGQEKLPEYSSDSSSSIGAPDDSEVEEEEESAVSSKGPLASLDALEESLPIKRGLSNFFSGKSKSFQSLSDVCLVSNMKEVEKPENPFNKRRRILMANKRTRRSSFYSWPNPKSMPLLTLNEDDDDDQEEDNQKNPSPSPSPSERQQQKGKEMKFKTSFKSQSCYCLTDLQEEDEDEGDQ